MYLFFDTETTGLPRDWNEPVTNSANWPRMVQLAWLLSESPEQPAESGSHIIYPEDYNIPRDAAALHGISTERAKAEGEALGGVLEHFDGLVKKATVLVAHNMRFDEKIVGAEFVRKRMENPLERKVKVCTMLSSTDYCRLPGSYGFKWPRLSELHYKLFRTHFEDAHNAVVDIAVTAKCFWELKRLEVIP